MGRQVVKNYLKSVTLSKAYCHEYCQIIDSSITHIKFSESVRYMSMLLQILLVSIHMIKNEIFFMKCNRESSTTVTKNSAMCPFQHACF